VALHFVQLLYGVGGAERSAVEQRAEVLVVEPMASQSRIVSANAATLAIIQWFAASFRREPIPASPPT